MFYLPGLTADAAALMKTPQKQFHAMQLIQRQSMDQKSIKKQLKMEQIDQKSIKIEAWSGSGRILARLGRQLGRALERVSADSGSQARLGRQLGQF